MKMNIASKSKKTPGLDKNDFIINQVILWQTDTSKWTYSPKQNSFPCITTIHQTKDRIILNLEFVFLFLTEDLLLHNSATTTKYIF